MKATKVYYSLKPNEEKIYRCVIRNARKKYSNATLFQSISFQYTYEKHKFLKTGEEQDIQGD